MKVWQVADGKRLYTLSDSTDWVYSVAWSPDGHRLAAAGVDKSIRVWEVSAQGGKLVHAVFAHEGPVVRVAWSADGKTLYSLSEDRVAKAWDAGRMVERVVYPKQPEAPLALAVRPDQKQIAIGRYDGALVLLEESTGKVQGQPLPAKPKPPVLNKATPTSAVRGQTVRIKLEGQNLDGGAGSDGQPARLQGRGRARRDGRRPRRGRDHPRRRRARSVSADREDGGRRVRRRCRSSSIGLIR